MHSNDLVGSLGRRRDATNCNGRGVGGQNGFRRTQFVELGKQLEFDVHVLGGSLYDQGGTGHGRCQLGVGADAGHCCSSIFGGQ